MKKILTVLLVGIFLFALVSADMKLSLINSQATFSGEIGDTIEYSVGAINKNSFPINISLGEPYSVKIDYHGPMNFELQPNESREINYTLTLNESGNIETFIPVNFISEENKFSLQQMLFLKVNEIEKEASSSGGGSGGKTVKKAIDDLGSTVTGEINITQTNESNETRVAGGGGVNENETEEINGSDDKNEITEPKLWTLILAFVIVLIIVLGMAYFLSRKKEEETDEKETDEEE